MTHLILDDTFTTEQIEDLEFYIQRAFDEAGPAMLEEHGEDACMNATFRVRIEVAFNAE